VQEQGLKHQLEGSPYIYIFRNEVQYKKKKYIDSCQQRTTKIKKVANFESSD
jgi:hypothetical protein